jgi:DNA-binding MarR family transcriptional regulator
MWLNLFWWVFLFGAQLAHSVSHLSRLSREDRPGRANLGPWDYLGGLLAVARWQASEASPIRLDDIADALSMREEDAERLTWQLCDAGLICRLADERRRVYVLVRPANRISIKDVLCLGGKGLSGAQGDRDIAEKVAGVRNLVDSGVENITIDQIIRSQQQATESEANEEQA